MAKNLGSSIKTFIKSSASYVWLGGETSSNINLNAEVQEYTDKSSKWAQNMAGKMSGTLGVTVYADNEDAGQKAAITAFLAGTEVDFVQGASDGKTAPTSGWKGKGIITSLSDTYDSGAISSRSLSITTTGEVAMLGAE